MKAFLSSWRRASLKGWISDEVVLEIKESHLNGCLEAYQNGSKKTQIFVL